MAPRTTAPPNGKTLETIGGTSPTNDAEEAILTGAPYVAHVTIEGTAALLFHRWSNEAVAEKAAAAKGSAAKKTDNVESYVYRDPDGQICLPGEYLRMALCFAAKYKQDPRSPRKSMMDMVKAGLVVITELAPMVSANTGRPTTDWDYLDERRVMVQRAGVTRQRPAFTKGWRVEFDVLVNLPEYIPASVLRSLLYDAGRLVGVADFRPTYGRFDVVSFSVG